MVPLVLTRPNKHNTPVAPYIPPLGLHSVNDRFRDNSRGEERLGPSLPRLYSGNVHGENIPHPLLMPRNGATVK
jgi:hypothetical protein